MLSPGLGNYLALTGASLESADLRDLHLAMFFCTTDVLPLVEERLGMTFGTQIKRVFDALMETVTWDRLKFSLEDNREAIERCFGQPSVEKIFEALEAENTKWSAQTLRTLQSKSPLSLKVTFRLLQEQKSFQDRAENFTKFSKKDLLQLIHGRLRTLTLDEVLLNVDEDGPDPPPNADLFQSVSSTVPTPKYLLREHSMQKLLDTLGVRVHEEQILTVEQFNRLAADFAATRRVDEQSPIPLPIPSPSLRNIAYTLAVLFGDEMETVLARDYLIAQRFFTVPDFLEGLTAFEENRSPRWSHKSVYEVTDEEVERFFRPPSTSESPLLFARQAVGVPLKSWIRMEWERIQLELAPFDPYLQTFRNNHLSAVGDLIFYQRVLESLYQLEKEFSEDLGEFEEKDSQSEETHIMREFGTEEGTAEREEEAEEEDEDEEEGELTETQQRALELAEKLLYNDSPLTPEEAQCLQENPELLQGALKLELSPFDPSMRFTIHRSRDLDTDNKKVLNYLRQEWYVRKFKETLLDVVRTPYADPNDTLPIKPLEEHEEKLIKGYFRIFNRKEKPLTVGDVDILNDLEHEGNFLRDTIASEKWMKDTGHFFEEFNKRDLEKVREKHPAPPQNDYDDMSLDSLTPKESPKESENGEENTPTPQEEEYEGPEDLEETDPDPVDEEGDDENEDPVIDLNPAYPQDYLEDRISFEVGGINEEEGEEGEDDFDAGYFPQEEHLIKQRRDAEESAEKRDIQELNVDDDYDDLDEPKDDVYNNTLAGTHSEFNDESQEVEYIDSDDEDQEMDDATFNSMEVEDDEAEDPEDESNPIHIIHRPSPEDVKRHKALPYGFNHPEDQPL